MAPAPCTPLPPPMLGQNFSRSISSGCGLRRGGRRTVPTGSPHLPELDVPGRRAHWPWLQLPRQLLGGKAALCMGHGLLPATGTLLGTRFVHNCVLLASTLLAIPKEAAWSTGKSRVRPLGLGLQPVTVPFLVCRTEPATPGGFQGGGSFLGVPVAAWPQCPYLCTEEGDQGTSSGPVGLPNDRSACPPQGS